MHLIDHSVAKGLWAPLEKRACNFSAELVTNMPRPQFLGYALLLFLVQDLHMLLLSKIWTKVQYSCVYRLN